MELLKLLLSMNLIFIVVKIATGNNLDRVEHINKQPLKLIFYTVKLIPYMNENDYKNTNIYKTFKSYIDEQQANENFIFYGESLIIFEVTNETNKIQLHVQNLKIDKTVTEVIINGSDLRILTPNVHINEETIVFHFDHNLLPKFCSYRIIIKFIGSITDNTGGFFKISYINDKGEKKWLIAAADFRGPGARQIFPCWDEPNVRTNFVISMKHHQNYTALSNTPINDKNMDDNGMVWTHFNATDKISPYHIAVVLSELEHSYTAEVGKTDTNWWCRQEVTQEIKFAQTIAKSATLYIKQIFDDINLPRTLNHIIIPGFQDGGVESWGLVLYRETAVIYDEKFDVISWKFQVAHMVARKIAHQYIGNLIGQSSWFYLWLNEGIATFLAMQIVKQFVHPHFTDLLVVQLQHESLRLNDYYNMPLIYEISTPSDISSLFSFTYYVKAPIFVRSLLQVIPLDLLEIGINDYLSKYQFRSIDTTNNTIDNFFNVLQKVLNDDLFIKTKINLKERFSFQMTQERYPVLQVTRNGNKIKIYLTERYPQKLWICVTYTTQENPNITETTWLTPHKSILYLDHINENHWIIVNVQQAGYYRVNYDNNNWYKLIKYLYSTKNLNIHVLNRAQIIDDAYYFLSTHKLDFIYFKSLTLYLSNETDYVAWYPMFKILEHASSFFPFPQSTEVKEHFRKILDFVLAKIKFLNLMKNDNFINCLRQEAAKWACTLNSQECTALAVSNLMWMYGETGSYGIFWPGWEEWTYCKGMILANNVTWNKVLKMEELNAKLFEFLACSENHTIIIDYINLLISGYFTVVEHHIAIFHSIIARHAKNDLVLDYILQNFVYVIPSEINTIVALTDIINHVYSKEQLQKIKNFMEKFSSEIYLHGGRKKIEIRSYELDRHIEYFSFFYKRNKLPILQI